MHRFGAMASRNATSTARDPLPPGRSENPSGWRKRVRVLLLAGSGLTIAGYLTAYQVGMFSTVWDPIFGAGSGRVLHSWLSRILPVPDASLGAAGYLLDLLLTSVGGEDRWRTMPLLVVALGLVASGMALVGIGLIIFQAFILNAFCTLCLASAAVSLAIWPLVWDEAAAALLVGA